MNIFSGKLLLFLSIILTCLQTACITPIMFKVNDERYKSEQPQVTILPFYAKTEQIYNLQKISPLLEGIEIDNQYYQYNEYDQEYGDSNKHTQSIFFIIISTKY